MVSAIPIEPSQRVRSVEPSVLRPYWSAVTLVGESKIILLAAYPTPEVNFVFHLKFFFLV